METHTFKVGDKLKIPTRKTKDADRYPLAVCDLMKDIRKYNKDCCYIREIKRYGETIEHICVMVDSDIGRASPSLFMPEDLDFYEEKPEIINNYSIF